MKEILLLRDINHLRAMFSKKHGWLWLLIYLSSILYSIIIFTFSIFAFFGYDDIVEEAVRTYGNDYSYITALMALISLFAFFCSAKLVAHGFSRIEYPLLIYAAIFTLFAIQLAYASSAEAGLYVLLHPIALANIALFFAFFAHLNETIFDYINNLRKRIVGGG